MMTVNTAGPLSCHAQLAGGKLLHLHKCTDDTSLLRQDYWVYGITLPSIGETYTEMCEEHRAYLESPEVINWILNTYHLKEDVFNKEYTYHNFTFECLDIDHRATWVFINEAAYIYEFTLDCDTLYFCSP